MMKAMKIPDRRVLAGLEISNISGAPVALIINKCSILVI
jgi:hypothetical protein